VRLTDVLVQGLRPQPVGQRPIGAVAGRAHRGVTARSPEGHLALRPITSTPGGGENVNRPGANVGFLVGWVNVNWVI
jgi:hypothetical protein